MHADFEYRKVNIMGETLVLIVDLNRGNRSVTNDSVHVLQTILADVPDLETFRVLYRDSEGQWDRITPMIRDGVVTNTYFAPGPRGAGNDFFERAWLEATT